MRALYRVTLLLLFGLIFTWVHSVEGQDISITVMEADSVWSAPTLVAPRALEQESRIIVSAADKVWGTSSLMAINALEQEARIVVTGSEKVRDASMTAPNKVRTKSHVIFQGADSARAVALAPPPGFEKVVEKASTGTPASLPPAPNASLTPASTSTHTPMRTRTPTKTAIGTPSTTASAGPTFEMAATTTTTPIPKSQSPEITAAWITAFATIVAAIITAGLGVYWAKRFRK